MTEPTCPRCRSPLRKRLLGRYVEPIVYELRCEMCGWRSEVLVEPKKEVPHEV